MQHGMVVAMGSWCSISSKQKWHCSELLLAVVETIPNKGIMQELISSVALTTFPMLSILSVCGRLCMTSYAVDHYDGGRPLVIIVVDHVYAITAVDRGRSYIRCEKWRMCWG